MHPSNKITEENVEDVFTYQPASPDQQAAYDAIRSGTIYLAKLMLANVPDCADRSAALRALRESRMWANAAIALNGKG